MTQDILSSMSSDEVNSISDTAESLQIANIIKTKYFDIMSRSALPENNQLFQLQPSGDNLKPVLMFIPDNVNNMEWIKYLDTNPADSPSQSQFGAFSHGLNVNIVSTVPWSTTSTSSVLVGTGTKTFTVAAGLTILVGQGAVAISGASSMIGTVASYSGTTLTLTITSAIGSGTFSSWTITQNTGSGFSPIYKYVTILPNDQFVDMVNNYNVQETGVGSFTFTEGAKDFIFYYRTDRQPRYCTVLSNFYVIFDSYDNTLDNTLQASKTMCYGYVVPTFSMTDSFIPQGLDDNQFPLLYNEAKALAFYELKQQPHSKAEQEIKRQWSSIQKNKSEINRPSYFDQLPSFGRMPRTGGYGTRWPKILR